MASWYVTALAERVARRMLRIVCFTAGEEDPKREFYFVGTCGIDIQ